MTTVLVLYPLEWVKATAACLAPRAGLTCLPWAWYMKNCSSLICYRFFTSPHESSKLRRVIPVCSDHTTPSCTKEHFAVQAVPLRWIKASRSVRYAARSRLAQGKHHCHKSFEEESSTAAPERVSPSPRISSVPACCWQGKSLPGHVRGAAPIRGWRPAALTHIWAQGCALQLCGHLVLHPKAWVPPCQNDNRQPWALALIPLGIAHAPPPGKPLWLHSSITFSSQKSRRDTWVWPLQVGTTITCCLGVTGESPRLLLGPGAAHLHSSLPSILMDAGLDVTTLLSHFSFNFCLQPLSVVNNDALQFSGA